jgi:hypothetical protein|tara:strand:+ start:13734 stop:14423 length:690 start_codon:yes stop_codon:yes gene_type:complete
MVDNKIQFVSMWEGMPEELYPQPSRLEYPKWFKDMPILTDGQKKYDRGGTVKRCPSFIEWFGQGYLLKMWADVVLNNSDEGWGWRTPDSEHSWDRHPKEQFEDYLPHDRVNVVYKCRSPWKVLTPPGWSCYELPLLFDYNRDWEVMAGINGTDTFFEWNTTICLFGDKKEIFIPRGTPISQIVPFKRKKLKPENKYYGDIDKATKARIKLSQYNGRSMFTGSYKIGKYE